MYRIFCESYQNFLKSLDEDNIRRNIAKPFELIVDEKRYKEEANKQSDIYINLCDLLYFMKQNIERFPRMKAFLWTLESRGIKEELYNKTSLENLEEQTKLINSFLKLAYWY